MDGKKHSSFLKDFPGLMFGFIFVISLGIFMLIFGWISSSYKFSVSVSVQEMGEVGYNQAFTFSYLSLIKIILLGPVHGIIIYLFLGKLIEKISHNDEKKQELIKKTLLILLVLFLMINMTGHVVHWICDRANGLYQAEHGGYGTTETYLIMYYADEFLAHGMIHVSYFVFLCIGTIAEGYNPEARKMKPIEVIITIIVGLSIIAINGEAAKAGESGLLLLILSLGAVIFILAYKISQQ
jgi:hypothetical protein